MKKMKHFIIAGMLLCLLFGTVTVSADTKTFSFTIYPEKYSSLYYNATKDDDEQTAYVTPTSISGSGTVWVTIYNENMKQCVTDISISSGEANVHKTGSYYLTGVAGKTYYLNGGDPEWQVTSDSFTVSGRWTP